VIIWLHVFQQFVYLIRCFVVLLVVFNQKSLLVINILGLEFVYDFSEPLSMRGAAYFLSILVDFSTCLTGPASL